MITSSLAQAMMLWSAMRAMILVGSVGGISARRRGNDELDGGGGNDTFLIRQGTGVDTIAHLQAGDA